MGSHIAMKRLAVGVLGCVVAAGCSSPQRPVTAEPQAAPAAVVSAPAITTLEEARALRATPAQYEAALRTLTKSDDSMTRRRGLALLGLTLHEQKRYDEAIPLLNEAASTYAEVAPFLRLRVVEAEEARGNLQNAAAAAAEIIALGDTSAGTVARLRLPSIFAGLNDVPSTNAAFQQAMAVPIDELTELDFVDLAKRLAKAGRTDLASTLRMRLLTEYTQGRYTEQTYDYLKAQIDALPPAEKLALATKLARSDRYDQALALFSQLPQGAEEARAARMRAQFSSRNYTKLLEETKDVTLTDPALVGLRARAAWRAGRPDELLAGLALVEKQWPASKEASDAKVTRAKYYTTDVVDYDRAIQNLKAAMDAGAMGSEGENLWNLGWTYTLQGKYDEALRTYDRYIAAYPDGDWRTNSLFWSAKIHDKAGRTAERDAKARQIIAEYPFSYYAYRAKELWGLPSVATASTAAFPDLDAELAKVSTDPRFVTINELLEIDLNRAATREMKRLAAAYEDNAGVQFLLADVYVRGGEPFRANSVLQRRFRQFVRHGGSNIPQRFWQILFPLAYWDTIQSEAARRGHDPYLLASIIRQESGFEPTTVSNAGAVGLMQIMPEEASRIGEAGGIGAVTRTDLFDPSKNIAVGAAEYSQKLDRMQGNRVLAIAAYNAGESAVGTWLEKTPVDDIDLFIEAIPYAETRLYVKTVSRNRFEYRRIYEGSAVNSTAARATTP
ncbi:MAG: soluble lytic murein transglycosylase [Acidobacteriota bacterium]|jgi:soluble lytic murein transglycosylase|nr:soluble lytic murein transglycosylase [Acidobacteriota bacterium]